MRCNTSIDAVAGGLVFLLLGWKEFGRVLSIKLVASVRRAVRNGTRRGRPSASRVVLGGDVGASSEDEDDGGCLLCGEDARYLSM